MKKKIFAIILLLSLCLTSCIIDPSAKRDYVSAKVLYSEPVDQYTFSIMMNSTETEFAKYFFEASIDNEERELCISATEKVLSSQESTDTIPEIYVFSQERYNSKYIRDHSLYCTIQNWNSAEYITDILLTAYGKSAHYGTVVGYSGYLANNFGWGNQEGKFSIPSSQEILDLNYLCFDNNFSSSNDVNIAKEVACDFVDTHIKNYGEKSVQKLLSSYSDALNALSSYYVDNGLTYAPSSVRYSYGGESFDYIVYSDCGTFYISNNWVDTNADYNPLISDGFLHSSYRDTKAFFETNIKQMKQYQDLFELSGYNNDLDIVFTKPLSASKYSFYQRGNHRIYVYNVDSLMHEYIHSLTSPTVSMENWQIEGFARYFSYYYDFYGIAFLNQDYNHTPNVEATKYVHEYLDIVNRPIDMAKDYAELENIAVYSRSYSDPNDSYVAGSSFVQYLVKLYGEKVVIDHIYGNRTSLPKNYDDLIKEWNDFIDTNYQGYSKYN